MKKFIQALVLLAFAPWANAATIDLTAAEWNFDAVLFNGAMGVSSGFAGSTLLFDSQTPRLGGGFDLAGSLEWETAGAPIVTSSVTGIYDGASNIAFLSNTANTIFTLFQGVVDDTGGNFLVGSLDGLFRSDMNGFWFATRGAERSGPIPPIALPSSVNLFLSALGIWFVMTRKV